MSGEKQNLSSAWTHALTGIASAVAAVAVTVAVMHEPEGLPQTEVLVQPGTAVTVTAGRHAPEPLKVTFPAPNSHYSPYRIGPAEFQEPPVPAAAPFDPARFYVPSNFSFPGFR